MLFIFYYIICMSTFIYDICFHLFAGSSGVMQGASRREVPRPEWMLERCRSRPSVHAGQERRIFLSPRHRSSCSSLDPHLLSIAFCRLVASSLEDLLFGVKSRRQGGQCPSAFRSEGHLDGPIYDECQTLNLHSLSIYMSYVDQ